MIKVIYINFSGSKTSHNMSMFNSLWSSELTIAVGDLPVFRCGEADIINGKEYAVKIMDIKLNNKYVEYDEYVKDFYTILKGLIKSKFPNTFESGRYLVTVCKEEEINVAEIVLEFFVRLNSTKYFFEHRSLTKRDYNMELGFSREAYPKFLDWLKKEEKPIPEEKSRKLNVS